MMISDYRTFPAKFTGSFKFWVSVVCLVVLGLLSGCGFINVTGQLQVFEPVSVEDQEGVSMRVDSSSGVVVSWKCAG